MRFLLLLIAVALVLPAAQAAPEVASKPLAQVAFYPEREASAQAVALNESRIAAEIAARVEAIPVLVL